jgi:hypothetical protein
MQPLAGTWFNVCASGQPALFELPRGSRHRGPFEKGTRFSVTQTVGWTARRGRRREPKLERCCKGSENTMPFEPSRCSSSPGSRGVPCRLTATCWSVGRREQGHLISCVSTTISRQPLLAASLSSSLEFLFTAFRFKTSTVQSAELSPWAETIPEQSLCCRHAGTNDLTTLNHGYQHVSSAEHRPAYHP